MFDLSTEAVRCDRNGDLLLLARDRHATNRRVIRVNNLRLSLIYTYVMTNLLSAAESDGCMNHTDVNSH